MSMFLLWVGTALAFDLTDEGVVASTTGPISAVLVDDLDGDGAPETVIAADGVTSVVGDAAATVPIEALALALADLDGDGQPELLGCSASGLHALDLGVGVRRLTTKPCSALAIADLDADGDDDVLTAGVAVLLWEAVDGALEGPTDLGQRLSTVPLVAAAAGVAHASEAGSRSLWTMDLATGEESTLPAPIGGLYATLDGLAWVATSPPELHLPSGETVGLQSGSTLLSGADWDADGHAEFAVLQFEDGVISLVEPDAPAVIGEASIEPGDRLPSQLAFADEDGDGCPDLAIALDSELSLWRGDCSEPPNLDQDEDGWRVDEGDCDDENVEIHPAALEQCNGIDDDCDLEVDEYSLALNDAPITNNEGGSARVHAVLAGCVDDSAWQIDDPDAVVDCVEGDSGDRLTCSLLDDGVATVSFLVLDGTGTTMDRRDVTVTVTNVDPALTEGRGVLSGEAGGLLYETFDFIDLGARDSHTWTLEGAPAGVTIEDGTVRWQTTEQDVGEWEFTVRLEDDDGGVAETQTRFDVRQVDAWGSSWCCCGFGATAGLVLPLGLLVSARRRRTGIPAATTPRR